MILEAFMTKTSINIYGTPWGDSGPEETPSFETTHVFGKYFTVVTEGHFCVPCNSQCNQHFVSQEIGFSSEELQSNLESM